jgi:hypothetical protein
MVDDYPTEKLIQKYAKENKFTLIANSPGTLEYVKFDKDSKKHDIIMMKWSKGTDDIIITSNGISKRLKIDTLIFEEIE